MTQVAGTSLCRKIPGGLPQFGVLSFPGIEQILYVSEDSTFAGAADGTIQKPYTTIGAAVTAANALTPTEANRILILVYPGIYSEQVTLADDYVYLVGVSREACILFNNTGTPLTVSADVTAVWTMTIQSDAGQGIADILTGSADFYECKFVGDDTAGEQVSINTTGTVRFSDCQFDEDDDGNVIFGVGGSAATVLLEGCDVVGSCTLADGDVAYHDCQLFSTHGTATVQAQTGLDSLRLQACSVVTDSSGDAISVQSQTDLVLLGNELETLAGTYAVQAAAAVTGAIIEDNVMVGGGIHANVSHVKPERIVGSTGMQDWYGTIREALISCTFSDVVVKLRRDETVGAVHTWTSGTVIVDGQGKHTYTGGAGNLIALASTGSITFRDIVLEGRIYQNGNGTLRLENCEVLGRIEGSVGSATTLIEVIDSEILGVAGLNYAIRIQLATSYIVLKRSRLKGVSGQPAILWDGGVTNDNVEVQDCAIMHGSLGANNPFGRNAAQTPDYRSTHSIYNLDPQTGAIWTNLVAAAQRFDSYDVNGDY